MRTVTGELRHAIEACYDAFAVEPHPTTLDASYLRDASAILATLSSAPLRQLSGDLIGPYSGWALTTVGDGRAYRHFLPRILELAVVDPVWIGSEPAVIASKLILAEWRSWPARQRQAVETFLLTAFDDAAGRLYEIGEGADDWLCALLMLGEDPSVMIARWLRNPSPHAAVQLAAFRSGQAAHLRRHGEVRGPWWQDVPQDKRVRLAEALLSADVDRFLQTLSEADRYRLGC
jgi:hypothetical protein